MPAALSTQQTRQRQQGIPILMGNQQMNDAARDLRKCQPFRASRAISASPSQGRQHWRSVESVLVSLEKVRRCYAHGRVHWATF
jgi:hypothetical protein